MKNYSKIIAEEWNPIVREAQIKNGHNAPVEINDKPTLIHQDTAKLMARLIYEETLELMTAIEECDIVEQYDACADITFLVCGLVAQLGGKDVFERVMDEVLRSNKSKLVGGKMRMRDDGKVLKPDTYEAPNLKSILF